MTGQKAFPNGKAFFVILVFWLSSGNASLCAMATLSALLSEYGESHQNPTNKLVHWVAAYRVLAAGPAVGGARARGG